MGIIKIDIGSGEEIGNSENSDTQNNDEQKPEVKENDYPRTELQIPLNTEIERQNELPPGFFVDIERIDEILKKEPRKSN
jgi:hypothetical protein